LREIKGKLLALQVSQPASPSMIQVELCDSRRLRLLAALDGTVKSCGTG
jgi:hypothetical protein